MTARRRSAAPLDPAVEDFYRRTLRRLNESRIPFLLGGAFAFRHYTGIERDTHDLDVFVRAVHRDQVLTVLNEDGCETELTFPHWLGKARWGDHYIDLIFSSGNGLAEVDAEWFDHGVQAEVLGLPVLLCPPEEMLWSKSFVMERERYDGADVAHLLRAVGRELDWDRLLRRFGEHWRVLLSHLILFTFIYPAERRIVPASLLRDLAGRLSEPGQGDAEGERACLGTLISRQQYLIDVEEWGYRDGRLPPTGRMTEAEIAAWTAAMENDPSAA